VPAVAYVGPTEWVRFHVDLVGSDLRMTGEPEAAPPLACVAMRDVEQHGYRVYPLVDHIADKVVAIFQRYGDQQRPSTRYKDLVDLVSIVSRASVAAEPQLTALVSEAERRHVTLPTRFGIPDRALWAPGYAAEAGRSLLSLGRTLIEALAIVGTFVDPLLDRTAAGAWDPGARRWRPGDVDPGGGTDGIGAGPDR
jgi:Nucleotidyl transferase AbiEii toxin, Type IV TA system